MSSLAKNFVGTTSSYSPIQFHNILPLSILLSSKSEERKSVPRFSYLLPQKCSQHINELAVGRRFGKCSSSNVLQEISVRLLPASPDECGISGPSAGTAIW